MKILNVRLLAILLGASVVFGGSVYFLHMYQMRREASFFLEVSERAKERAETAVEEKNAKRAQQAYIEAVKNLSWYLRFRPDDVDAAEKYAFLLADAGQQHAAIAAMEKLLRGAEERPGVRQKLVDLAIELGQAYQDPRVIPDPAERVRQSTNMFATARNHLQTLLLQKPGDPELLELLGRSQAAVGNDAEAAESFQQVIQTAPERLEAYPRLAGMLRHRLGRTKDADECMQKLVKANPDSCQAYLFAAAYWTSNGEVDKAADNALRALELKPDDRNGLLRAAFCAMQHAQWLQEEQQQQESEEQYNEAREYLKRGIELFPDDVQMYTTLADVEIRSRRPQTALEVLSSGLAATGNNPLMVWNMANLSIEIGKIDDVKRLMEQLREAQYPLPYIDYLRARLEFGQQHWRVAIEGFEKARSGLLGTATPHFVEQCDYFLARCYRQLGNTDQELAALQRALNIEPSATEVRKLLYDCLLRRGQTDDALQELRRIPGKSADENYRQLASILLLSNLRLPAAQRNWQQVENVLDEAERAAPEAGWVTLSRADVLTSQGRLDEADKLLLAASAKEPQRVDLWFALILLAQRRNDRQKVEQRINDAKQAIGDRPEAQVELRLAQARYFAGFLPAAEAAPHLRRIADENLEKLNDAQRVRLWRGLLGLVAQVKERDLLRQLCNRLAEKEPNNVQVPFMLFEVAMRADDKAGMQDALAQIKKLEGEGAYWHYAEALQLMMAAEGNNELREAARKHLLKAAEIRPTWSPVWLLLAGICDQQGNHAEALANYQKGIDLGDRNPMAIQRAADILQQQGRFADALNIIRLLEGQETLLSPALDQMEGQILAQLGQLEKPLEIARKTAASSKKFSDHIWLGQLLYASQQRFRNEGNTAEADKLAAEAEKSLLTAVTLADKTAETWVPLIRFYAGTGQTQKAEATIEQAKAKLPAEQAPLALAQCYEALGQLDTAAEKYKNALAQAPNESVVVRAVADFLARTGKTQQAEAQLRRIIDGGTKSPPADVMWARRALATMIFEQQGYQNLQKAADLIDKNLAQDPASAQDRRLKVNILAASPSRAHHDQAAQTLEGLLRSQQTPTPDDQYALAQIYLAQDDWSKYNSQMRTLLAAQGDNPQYLSAYANALLQHKPPEPQNAQAYLDKLQKVAPNQFATEKLAAQMAFRRGKYQQVLESLKAFLDRRGAQPADRSLRMRLVAESLQQFSHDLLDVEKVKPNPPQPELSRIFTRDAELIFRQFIDGAPGQEMLLVDFLGRQGQIDEALDVLERIWRQSTPLSLAHASLGLLKPGVGKQQFQRGEAIVQAALTRFDKPDALLQSMADIYTLHGRYAEAEALYRETLQKNPKNHVAMNNLAVLLALQKIKIDEATSLMDRAIQLAGPVGAMLDSRATVYLAAGHPEKAAADMEAALAEEVTPTHLFHQAQALLRLGKKAAAVEALAKANKLGLKVDDLYLLEKPDYDELQKSLQEQSPP